MILIMPKDTEIIDKNDTRAVPAPIRLALDVLARLEPARAEKLRKALPAYAMTLHRQGKKITERLLTDALAKGDDAIIGPRPSFTRAAETVIQRYERHCRNFSCEQQQGRQSEYQDYPSLPNFYHLMRAAENSDIETMKKITLDNVQAAVKNDFLIVASGNGCVEMVEYLLANGADIHAKNDAPLFHASANGNLATVRCLLNNGADMQAEDNKSLKFSQVNNHHLVMAELVSHGADRRLLTEDKAAILANIENWVTATGNYPPEGLEEKPPGSFDAASINTLGTLLEREGYPAKTANRYAFQALSFFGTAEKVMDYFEKWARPGKQPLHDVIQMIRIPEPTRDLADWVRATLKHGPEMAKLVKFADKLASPARSADGKGWSLVKTRDATARYAYPDANRNPKLARLFNRHQVDADAFSRALEIVSAYKDKGSSGIPDITIDGKKFNLPKATFRKLPDGDYRGLVLGEITDCCQSIGGQGEDCARHGFLSRNSGFYIVAVNDNKKNEEIIGQSWAWWGENNELVLDSLETLGTRLDPKQWTSLINEFAKALKEESNASGLYIGKGGDTPKNLPFADARPPAEPIGYTGYRDSIKQYKIW